MNMDEAAKTSLELGLKFSKTSSLLEEVNRLFSKGIYVPSGKEQPSSSCQPYSVAKGMSKEIIMQQANKLKAESFNISLLRIGEWQRVSKNDGDLVGKCYFAKKKLVWEILENGLKRKIEIQWPDILSLRAALKEGQVGIFEVELTQPPLFFHEQDPQPRKHTQWNQVSDFTGGQALTYRRHYLEFPPRVLDAPLEKLLSYDSRLNKLSQQGFPTLNLPYFPNPTYENSSSEFDGELPITPRHQQRQQQFSVANVPTYYQTSEPAPLIRTPIDYDTEMELLKFLSSKMPDDHGSVMNFGDNLIPNQATVTMMPVMTPNAATSMSFQNNYFPQSEFAGPVPLQQQPLMFEALDDQRQNMLLNNTQAGFSNGMTDVDLFLQGQLENNTGDPVSVPTDVDLFLQGQLENNARYPVSVPTNMVDYSLLMNNSVDNSVLTNNAVGGGQMNPNHQFGNNTNNPVYVPANMIDNSVLMNDAVGSSQMNPNPQVITWSLENNPFYSSLNSDDTFNHETNNGTRDSS